MHYPIILPLLALLASAQAARPANTSICDYYTTDLLKENTAANQFTLLVLLVNTAVIGNYTKPNVGIKVNGILNSGTYNGTAVNLLPFFNGGLASTNQGGKEGVAMNFLDDGGAAPLMADKPANGTESNQFTLLTHLYEFFGILLGCSLAGKETAFPAYDGEASMYNVHKFMALNPYQVGYFITQVGLSAASFGVSNEDVTAVGTALIKLFDHRCAPPETIIPSQGDALQAVCITETCPISENATCGSYESVVQPAVANGTLAMGGGANGTGTVTSTKSVDGITTATGTATESETAKGTSTGMGGKNATESSTGGAVKMAGSLASVGFAALMWLI